MKLDIPVGGAAPELVQWVRLFIEVLLAEQETPRVCELLEQFDGADVQLDLLHWGQVLKKLDELLAEHISSSGVISFGCRCEDELSKRFFCSCLKFFSNLLRNCQNKRLFLLLDVSDRF
jgi:hypothetical protein